MGISVYASASITSFRSDMYSKDDIQKALDSCYLKQERVFITELIYGVKIDFSVDYHLPIGNLSAKCNFGYETYGTLNKEEDEIVKKCIEDHQVEAKLTELCLNSRESLVFRGTIVGEGIRSNKYKLSKPTLIIYDEICTDLDSRSKFLDLARVCESLDLKCVPTIKMEDRPFTYEVPKTYSELIKELKNVKSVLNKDIDVSGVRLVGVTDPNLRFTLMHRELCLDKVS